MTDHVILLPALTSCTDAHESGNLKTKDRAATRVNRGLLSMALRDCTHTRARAEGAAAPTEQLGLEQK